MKDRNSYIYGVLVASAMLLLAAVAGPVSAFKIPGIPMAGGQSAVPAGGRGAASGDRVGHKSGNSGEYMGPVFIIREVDKDAELYDAFITTGGIQEAKPPAPVKGYAGGQQSTKSARPAVEEDSEYFGVLVTPETVRQIRFPKGLFVNVSMSMLLNAASSRMPWLLVLRRNSHSELSMGGGGSTPAPQAASDQVGGISPNMMQVPQRRRYYGGSESRQRRAVNFRFGADPEATRSVPLMLEREVLSTMCFNFAREFYQTSTAATAAADYWDVEEPQRGHRDAHLDVNAYAAAAARHETSPPSEPEPQEPGAVPMAVPKRVS